MNFEVPQRCLIERGVNRDGGALTNILRHLYTG